MTAQAKLFEDTACGAHFSDCRKFRFALWRIWDHSKQSIMFIGLNPSTANESEPDPTITRVKDFADSWGFGGVFMLNLFPFVTEYPSLLEFHDEYLQENDQWIDKISAICSEVVFAWGNFKEAIERGKVMINKFPEAKALVINKNGSPRHPLYVRGDTQLIKF